MIKASKKLLGKFVKIISEYSRAIKELPTLKKNYKGGLFSV